MNVDNMAIRFGTMEEEEGEKRVIVEVIDAVNEEVYMHHEFTEEELISMRDSINDVLGDA